ncbi:MAG TPA: hypothetical protein VMT86_09655 [Bryobacteraceae bacterium]|nr:hypothetical protein [Bryobacteraceae bacterium]
MIVDRTIRAMTREEKQAKREWGTGACQARGCTARAAYLLMETSTANSTAEEWWQYCCPKHARGFADEFGLELPPVPRRCSRPAVSSESHPAAS